MTRFLTTAATALALGTAAFAGEVKSSAADTTVDKELPLTTETAGVTDRPILEKPEVEMEGYASVEIDDLTTEDLTGARVYGPNDEDVGEVSELIITESGELDRAVIDVGGFLGIGEHPVAVTMDEIEIIRADNGDDLRVYIDSTQSTLEQQPEYQG